MKVEYPASSIQINYLNPLKKWRLLDLKNLMKESNYELSYVSFSKMISRLEKKGLIGSHRDPYSAKKYIYLTAEGKNYIGGKRGKNVSEDCFVHDSRVVDIVHHFMKYSNFSQVQLEHEYIYYGGDLTNARLYPDARFHFQDGKKKLFVALELELTRKCKTRYLDKIKHYLSNYTAKYDMIIYYFQNRGILESYQKHIYGTYGMEAYNRIHFCLNEKLLSKKFNFEETIFVKEDREWNILEFLKLESERNSKVELTETKKKVTGLAKIWTR